MSSMSTTSTAACAQSGCKASAPHACAGCKRVFYCGKDHQKKHWKTHKPECRPSGFAASSSTSSSSSSSSSALEATLFSEPTHCDGRFHAYVAADVLVYIERALVLTRSSATATVCASSSSTTPSPRRTVVSVGSGVGYFEAFVLATMTTSFSWITIDPQPHSYQNTPLDTHKRVLMPQHATVDAYLATQPASVATAPTDVLFLGWPTNEAYDEPSANDDHDAALPFDVEAIRKLRPRTIVLLYETIGAAGSAALHRFLVHTGARCADAQAVLTPEEERWSREYVLEHSHYLYTQSPTGGDMINGLLLLRRRDVPSQVASSPFRDIDNRVRRDGSICPWDMWNSLTSDPLLAPYANLLQLTAMLGSLKTAADS